jgi:hypothetical protein
VPLITRVGFSGGEWRIWGRNEYPTERMAHGDRLGPLVTRLGGLGCRGLGVCDRTVGGGVSRVREGVWPIGDWGLRTVVDANVLGLF